MRAAVLLMAAMFAMPSFAQDVPLPRERPDRAAMEAQAEAAGAQTQEAGTAAPVGEAAAPAQPAAEAVEPVAPATETETAPSSDSETAPATETAPEGEPEAALPTEPARIYQSACPAVILGMIEATMLPPITEGQCHEQSPMLVTAVRVGARMVPLSSPATLNCEMAMSLPRWAEAIDGYLFARENTGVARLLTGTSYMCRRRNNAATGNISEHGLANALDVTGFELVDGRSVTLPSGWGDAASTEGRVLRFAHDAACSIFATTLGPEANAEHADHLHIDMGCHGKTCTARLCE